MTLEIKIAQKNNRIENYSDRWGKIANTLGFRIIV